MTTHSQSTRTMRRTLQCAGLTMMALRGSSFPPLLPSQSLIKNGSFQEGAAGPNDWHLMPGGS